MINLKTIAWDVVRVLKVLAGFIPLLFYSVLNTIEEALADPLGAFLRVDPWSIVLFILGSIWLYYRLGFPVFLYVLPLLIVFVWATGYSLEGKGKGRLIVSILLTVFVVFFTWRAWGILWSVLGAAFLIVFYIVDPELSGRGADNDI